MSTSHSDELFLRPFDEIDISVPECGVTVLPGRLAALTHTLNKGREILLPDREWYDPDVCTVVSSGVSGFDPGEVVVLAPDHGAFYPSMSPDGREVRMVGVVKPWWESVLGKLSADEFAPGPGWMLVEREQARTNPNKSEQIRTPVASGRESGDKSQHSQTAILLPDTIDKFSQTATVIASYGDGWSRPHEGERVCIDGLRTYTFREVLPESWALVRVPIASKKWLSSLNKAN